MRAVVLLALAAWPAVAQTRPVTTPTRDVDVTYRAGPAEATVTQRSRWAVAGRRMRLDTPTPGVYVIVDYQAQTMAMVSDGDRGVLDLPVPPGGLPGQGTDAGRYTRRGEAVVAGLPCTEWETVDSQGQPALACFTADGVLLEARRGAAVLVQAVRVSYGPLEAGLFAVPAGYRHEQPPKSGAGR